VGSKAGEELPDLSIHPHLGLIHLGDQKRKDREKEQRGKEGCP
jgi:hypothetical protein